MAERPKFLKNWLLVRQLKKLVRRIESISFYTDDYENDVFKTENEILNDRLRNILHRTSADVLKKYKTGARMQPFSRLSVYDILCGSEDNLSSINGAGPKSARLIKECAEEYAREVRDTLNVILDTNDTSKRGKRLAQDLYAIDLMKGFNDDVGWVAGKYLNRCRSVIEDAKPATNPFIWLFSKNRDLAVNRMAEVSDILSSPLTTEINGLQEKRSQIIKKMQDDYWQVFTDNPVRYQSLIEQVYSKKSGKTVKTTIDSYLEGLTPEIKKKVTAMPLDVRGLKCILRPYQIYGVKYILSQGYVLLGDEMGLGKTIEAIAAIVSLRNAGKKHFVVVCPASVLVNWQREITKNSDIPSYLLHGPSFRYNLNSWINYGGIAVLNFENAYRFSASVPIALTVVDEAHYIKNPNADRSANTAEILEHSERKLLMTGTPLENKLEEMVALISLLQPGIAREVMRMPRPINKEQYKKAIAPVYFRRTKDTVWKEMPELENIEMVIGLTPAEHKLYSSCARERNMKAFVKMRQISFQVDSTDSSKLARINEICEEAISNNRKIIIFSFYLDTIEMIKNNVRMQVFGPITGSISPSRRQSIIDDFSRYPGGAILLSQILAGGTGLNIQQASIIIICEPQFKPSIENQAIARAYRIGQKSNVTVYHLLNQKTVDERIIQVLKEKQAVFDAYADKSLSGEKSIEVTAAEIAKAEFENPMNA